MTQPSKNETTVQQNSLNPRTERMSLAAYLAAGVGLAGITGAAEAAIVNINLTDTRGDGNYTTADNISGVNAGLNVGGVKSIYDWLGPNTGTLYLFRQRSYYGDEYWGLDGNPFNVASLQFLTGGSTASPTNLSSGSTIGGSTVGTWSSFPSQTSFKFNSTVITDFGPGSYMGFRFGSTGQFNYGWLEVTWNSTSLDWQILSGAYESTVNTAIVTPSANVPAPSPASLLALIVGGAALRQWRRGRRKQLLEQTAA